MTDAIKPVRPVVPIGDKVAHVVAAGQDRDHACHCPGCPRQVPPAVWGCRPCWYRLPIGIRRAIWKTYRIGQERDGRPNAAYLEAAQSAQAWLRDHPHAHPAPAPSLF